EPWGKPKVSNWCRVEKILVSSSVPVPVRCRADREKMSNAVAANRPRLDQATIRQSRQRQSSQRAAAHCNPSAPTGANFRDLEAEDDLEENEGSACRSKSSLCDA